MRTRISKSLLAASSHTVAEASFEVALGQRFEARVANGVESHRSRRRQGWSSPRCCEIKEKKKRERLAPPYFSSNPGFAFLNSGFHTETSVAGTPKDKSGLAGDHEAAG